MALIEPKDVEIDGINFVISKFPAVPGREIVAKYALTSMPKVGDYSVNQETMLKLMAYVAISNASGLIQLTTQALINNHVPSWETLAKLEWAMMEYNCSFFQNGRVSSFFDDIARKVPSWITKTLTGLLQQLSATEKPRSTN